MKKRRIKLFSHDDIDGYGSNILLRNLPNTYYNCINTNVYNINDKVRKYLLDKEYIGYDITYITDISVDEATAKLIENANINIKLLDHHNTAYFLNKYDWATVTETGDKELTCGTELLFKELEEEFKGIDTNLYENIKRVVTAIQRYDTWLWDTKYNDITARKLNDLFSAYGSKKFLKILDDYNCDMDKIFKEYSMVIEIEENNIQKAIDKKIKNIYEKEIVIPNHRPYSAGIVFEHKYVNDVGNALAKLTDYDVIIVVKDGAKSYRTIKDDVDCSAIAKYFGGGGHYKSAGSKITNAQYKKIIDILLSV